MFFIGFTVSSTDFIVNILFYFDILISITYMCDISSLLLHLPEMTNKHVFSDHFQFMMTSSNGNIFRVTGHLCGEFTGPGEFPAQRPVMRSFDVFFDLRLNKRLSKQWGGGGGGGGLVIWDAIAPIMMSL